MKKICFLITCFLSVGFMANAQLSIESQKCFGGNGDDGANKIITLRDGGYIFAGYAASTNGDVTGFKGGLDDVWVVKVSSSNTIEWQKCIGGTDLDAAFYIFQTKDGGFCLTGETTSTDGDFADNHGGYDAFIVKLDSLGTIEWKKCLGGSNDDGTYAVFPTTSGGYMAVGYTSSTDGDVSGNHGGADAWVVELDSKGNIVWQHCYGGSQDDEFTGMGTDAGGNYYFSGDSDSPDGNVTGNHGDHDVWAVKTDTAGNLLAQKSYGGSDNEYGDAMVTLASGNFVIAGIAWSPNDGDVSGNHGSSDGWLIKINTNLDLLWQTCVGGTQYDNLNDVSLLNGNIVAAGYTGSNDGDFNGQNHGSDTTYDVVLVSLDTSGNKLFTKCYGGVEFDLSYGICVNGSDVYICGAVGSNDGDISGNHGGLEDAWVLHLSTISGVNNVDAFSKLSVYPNPSNGDFQLNFYSVKAADANISITNLLGEKITNKRVRVNEGDNSFSFKRNNMASGIYFLTVVSGGSSFTRKLIIN